MLRWLWLPGDTSAVDPMAAKSRPSSSTQSPVRKSQAGRRGVGQHVVQKEARKTSKDVHRTEEDTDYTESQGRQKPIHTAMEGSDIAKVTDSANL